MSHWIENLYLLSGLLLPAFYLPQILRLLRDQSKLEGYSLSKATAQLLLRLPVLPFAFFVVGNTVMNIVCVADVSARLFELCVSIHALKRQKVDSRKILHRCNPFRSGMVPLESSSYHSKPTKTE